MQLDYLFGRTVSGVTVAGGSAPGEWRVDFEGDAAIYCTDSGYEAPPGPSIIGLAFTAYDKTTGALRLYFGTNENPRGTVINLPITGYAVSDPIYTEGDVVNPESPVDPQVIPQDPEAIRQAEAAEAPE